MSAARETATPAGAPQPPAPQPGTTGRREAPAQARRLAARLRSEWLPHAAWALGRTGAPGLAGIALLLAATVFLFSTHLGVVAEVEALRAEVASAQRRAPPLPGPAPEPVAALRALPARRDLPAVLHRLFAEAERAGLAVDAGKYEVKALGNSGLVRFQISLPVRGRYPRVRGFVDAALASLPAVALDDLLLGRRSIADAEVHAQLRLSAYTFETGPPDARSAPAVADRVVEPKQDDAFFAAHSWYVPPPPRRPPPPPPPPPPPEPTAPPFPYTFVGRFAPGGDAPVFFLARGDRVIRVRVGDRIDGVYQLESAAPGQLVFVYLPLNVRQLLNAGGSK